MPAAGSVRNSAHSAQFSQHSAQSSQSSQNHIPLVPVSTQATVTQIASHDVHLAPTHTQATITPATYQDGHLAPVSTQATTQSGHLAPVSTQATTTQDGHLAAVATQVTITGTGEKVTFFPTYIREASSQTETAYEPSIHPDVDLDRYFVGPRDLDRHSKLPFFMRMHGSILPKMLVPLLCIGMWSTLITCISKYIKELAVSSLLLTVLGFVVALALSFRSTTAYERYGDGRKAWTNLTLISRNLARLIWYHIDERPGECAKEDLLSKVTAINLILAFAVALKHKLRFEPHTEYDDMKDLIKHLHTFAHEAYDPEQTTEGKSSWYKTMGEYLGIPFAESNPRKLLKRSKKPVGNLPLEILSYLSAYTHINVQNNNLKLGPAQTQMLTFIAQLGECMSTAERVLNTPLPMAYQIAFSQITLIYVYVLPFQLYSDLGWVTIPATVVAAFLILGISTIGSEIENPFGHDVNDLPLDSYCQELSAELNVITSQAPPKLEDFIAKNQNLVLHPISKSGYEDWSQRNVGDIRDALRARSTLSGRKPPRNRQGRKVTV